MPPSSGKAQLFVDENYGGASATLEVGTYNIGDGTGAVGNDTISSLKVEPGYQVAVYTDRDCKGNGQIFIFNTPRIPSDLNDAISSVRVEPLPEPNTGGQQVVFVQPPSF